MLIACVVLALSTGSVGAAAPRYDINIPVLSAEAALKMLARQTTAPLLFPYDLVKKFSANPVSGRYTLNEALERLLQNTGLSGSVTNGGVITITATSATTQQDGDEDMTGTRKLSIVGAFAALFGVGSHSVWADQTPSAAPETSSTESQAGAKSGTLQEVVVSARKIGDERLLDVPVPVTVVNTELLESNGQNRLQDYFATVPGLSLLGDGAGSGTQYLTLRGLSTTNSGGPVVAMVIDDVPFGLSTGTNLGQFGYPDIDPSDLARIEVLKGPQGTLYGADSLGGLIKIVTRDPSTAAFSGHVEVLGEGIPDGGLGYGVRGSVNVPISDSIAIRAGGFARRDPGYVDDVTSGQENVNSADTYGGRIAALWRPSGDVSLKLGALVQHTDGNGSPEINAQVNANNGLEPTPGNLQQSRLPGTGHYDTEVQLYTATLNAKLAGLDFVSVSGYGVNKWSNVEDISSLAQVFNPPSFSVTGTAEAQTFEVQKFSQELRLSSSGGRWLDWLAGGFYTHERAPFDQAVLAANSTTGAIVGTAYDYNYSPPLTFSEYAIFGTVTLHATNRFDVQLGGRSSWDHQVYNVIETGANLPSAYVQPTERAPGDATTYLVNPSFKITPDVLLYARVASGYRIGGPNAIVTGEGVPSSFKPDTTTNYDLGIKAAVLDHALTVDVSVYYISWKNIQVEVTEPSCGCYYETNGGRAKSEGVEFSVQAHPLQGTTISAEGSWNDAELTQDLPPGALAAGAYGLAGDRLPYSTPWSGSVTADQDIVHLADATGFVGASAIYVGKRLGEFESGAGVPRLQFPAYTTFNLHAGVRYDRWLINLFANNVNDRRGVIGGGPSYSLNSPGNVVTIIQPRTIGLSVSKDF